MLYNGLLPIKGKKGNVFKSRCLRQVPGNTLKARVYLSSDNFNVLDRQLQETYGETIADPNRADDPEYIVNLIGRVARVSVETVRIVGELPKKAW